MNNSKNQNFNSFNFSQIKQISKIKTIKIHWKLNLAKFNNMKLKFITISNNTKIY